MRRCAIAPPHLHINHNSLPHITGVIKFYGYIGYPTQPYAAITAKQRSLTHITGAITDFEKFFPKTPCFPILRASRLLF